MRRMASAGVLSAGAALLIAADPAPHREHHRPHPAPSSSQPASPDTQPAADQPHDSPAAGVTPEAQLAAVNVSAGVKFAPGMPSGPPGTPVGPPGVVFSVQPTTRPLGPPLPDRFKLLMIRSIFARGGMAAPPESIAGGAPQIGGPEGGLALRGVATDESQFIAFVEDTAAHHTLQVKTGDHIGLGRVSAITLDGLKYEAGGRTTQVRVGQNLLGMDVPAAQPAPPAQPPLGAPGPPPGPAGPPGQGPMPGPEGPVIIKKEAAMREVRRAK